MRFCIVGGGTTGWWSAKALEVNFPNAEITLIESPHINPIGVGESTLPQVGVFLSELGIPEERWMPKANAIHKHGNIKIGWDGTNKPFHFTFWNNLDNKFDRWVTNYLQGKISKYDHTLLYDNLAVAHHLDADLIGQVVKEECNNVIHLQQHINNIKDLPEADLYLDCTGFKQLICKDKTRSNISPHHKVNSAIVQRFKKKQQWNNTYSVASPYGWQFWIDLQDRIGTGYIYDNTLTTDEQAKLFFQEKTSEYEPLSESRVIKWTPYYLQNAWTDNVVCIGLANGFIDPLESNALYMTQYSISLLIKCLKRHSSPKAYNKALNREWRNNSEYILCHYMMTNKEDTSFWKYYRDFDVSKIVWDNYQSMSNYYYHMYPDAIWAQLGLYFEDVKHYRSKNA